MAKYRSKTNYAQIYTSDEGGMNLGLDGAIYLREEATPRVFNAPRIGTQGSSIGDAAASDDISAHASPGTLKATVSGGAQVIASVATAGLTTGALIAAALETAINTALTAAGQDARVWVDYDSGDDHYEVYDQSTGTTSAVVIAVGDTNDLAADLLLGLANGGTEAVGTNDQDFLLYTTGGATFDQPASSNEHRAGRFHTGVVKAKKVVEFDFDTYINMSGSAGDSLDTAVRLLWESLLGTETVNAGVSIDYTQGLPTMFFSMVRVSTIFAEYFTGCYVKGGALNFPGAGPATCKWTGRGANSSVAGIGQLSGALSTTANAVLNAGDSKQYTAGSRVMGVAADGRTILEGADGSISVVSVDDNTNTLVLSGAVTLPDDGFIVPWDPGAVQQTGRDAIFTDLEGSFKWSQGDSEVCLTDISLDIQNEHNDRDQCFGTDTNKGFAAGNRCTMTLSATADLSREHLGYLVRMREFSGLDPEIILGSPSSGRYLRVRAPNWIPSVPPIELPQNGTTPVTAEGPLYQSAPGAKNPVVVSFR